MFQLTAVVLASEGGHEINESLHSIAPWIGVLAFIGFVGLMVITGSFSSRGLSPEVGEYEDHSQLSAEEQAMLRGVGSNPHQH